MIRLSAHLSMLFTEVALRERFRSAAIRGFRGVECGDPYALDPEWLGQELASLSLELVLINMPAGHWANGDRGLAAIPDRVGDFAQCAEQAIGFARATRCRSIHALAGLAPSHDDQARAVYIDNIRRFARAAAQEDVTVLIEPISTLGIPGYFLQSLDQAATLIAEINEPNLRLLFDIFHVAAMGEDILPNFLRLLPLIGHIQIADHPGRHEPGSGKICFRAILEHVEASGYLGWIGCEYVPRESTDQGIDWARAYLSRLSSFENRR